MLKAYPFGNFEPDKVAIGGTNLSVARNVYPIADGYSPVGAFTAITPALAATFTGGAAFIGSDGTASLLAGTAAGLYRYSGGAWTSVYTAATTSRYRFTQFGDNIIIANGGALVSYGLLTGTAAAIAAPAPTATDVATVRDYVVALGNNGNQLSVRWSQFNNSAAWTEGLNGADDQPLLSGGKGVAIVGGEYGIVLQRNAIKRMSISGDPVLIFQFDEIGSEIGCMSQGSVASVGKMVFFLSERGFMMCDGVQVSPIGDEKFNRWFFANYSRLDIDSMYSAIDPRRNLVMWAMPGRPGRILAYNWELGRASTIETGITGIFTGFTANTSADALDTPYPGGVDSIPISLDDASLSGGNPLLLIASDTSVVGTLGGATLDALFELENIEPTSGRRSRIRSLRPIGDMTAATVTVDARLRAGDAEKTVAAASMRDNGTMPIRANGRYCDISLGIPAGAAWTVAQGIEVEFEPGDAR